MTPLAAWLLSGLMALQLPHEPVRLESIARSLAGAVDLAVMTGQLPGHERRLWAAAALATALRESGNLARAVHAGERLGDGGRSICLMQINRGNRGALKGTDPFKVWRALAGIDAAATERCVRAGVLSLARMRSYCARRVPQAELLGATLSAYMHGTSCRMLAEGERRERLTRQLLD